MANINTTAGTSTDYNSFGTPSFKISDLLNVGDFFGNPGSDKGARKSSAINNIVDGAGAAGMSFVASDKTGNNKLQKKAAMIDAGFDAASAAAQFIPVAGPVLSLAMQGFQLGMQHLAPKMKGISVNKEIGGSSAFGGLASTIGNQSADIAAYNKAGVGKFAMNAGKMKSDTAELGRQQKVGVGVLRNNAQLVNAAGNNTNYLNQKNRIDFGGGIPSVAVGKNGLNTIFLKEFYKNRTLKLQNGGPINLIVNGKLHKELNHMKDVVDIPITTKGVPTVVKDQDGGILEQAAELERDEIILHLQLTRALEKLAEEDTDESMIEAGKLLAKEIIKNTKDSKSKLLKTVE